MKGDRVKEIFMQGEKRNSTWSQILRDEGKAVFSTIDWFYILLEEFNWETQEQRCKNQGNDFFGAFTFILDYGLLSNYLTDKNGFVMWHHHPAFLIIVLFLKYFVGQHK